MPNKTDRILGYLPGTFRVSPRPPVLFAVADAFGRELQGAENSLAAVMLSHWVDFADKNAPVLDDLTRMAALYGLAPRDDESVEEFRDHLKRYVRTFLDGTVTVQGLLRVTAEVLGLRIADVYGDLDSWWTRKDPTLVTVTRLEDDAAGLLIGDGPHTSEGSAAKRAEVVGTVPAHGIDLGGATHVRIATDLFAAKDVVLPSPAADLQSIVDAVNTACGQPCARADGSFLALASPTRGAASRLEILEGANDAAPRLLGLAPRTYVGGEALAAELTSALDLGAGVDLTVDRFLRIAVDATRFAEVDCADPASPAATGLDHIRDAINAALGGPVARHDGHRLTLQSPTKGANSTIAVQAATAQDAAPRIFGAPTALAIGAGDRPARVTSSRDLSDGVDLTPGSNLRLTVDGTTATVDVAGADPAHTQTIEIVTAVNQAFHARVASPDGASLTLSSLVAGPLGRIVIGTPADGDATLAVLGIRARAYRGTAATSARLVGRVDLLQRVDVMARRHLAIAVDGGPTGRVDLQVGAADPRAASLAEIVAAINTVSPSLASDDGHHLILASPTSGAASRLQLVLHETTLARRYVTRGLITSEASQALLGFVSKSAEGTSATTAVLRGEPDLRLGADLRDERYLRIVVDGRSFDVDCAGARARATLPEEVVQAINAAAPGPLATHDGKHLVLTSPTSGSGGSLDLGAPPQRDALAAVLGVAPGTTRGRDASRVIFTGLVDLSAGVELPANAAIKLAIDGGAPTEVPLCGAVPAHTSAAEIASAINLAMGSVVAPIGASRLILNSALRGAASKIELFTPAGVDATRTVTGVSAPRSYQGADAQPPRVAGKNLPAASNLLVARFLRVSLDGAPPQDVDCASEAADPTAVAPAEIAAAINRRLGPGIATLEGTRLILTSPTHGSAGRVELLPFSSGDARKKLLGDVALPARGTDAAPATMTGTAVVDGVVDLGERRWLRLAVNGEEPVNVDVAGNVPEATSLDEAVAAVNRAYPGMASATDEGRLRLVGPKSAGPSTLSVLPLRVLEVVEYAPIPHAEAARVLASGQSFSLVNEGASASSAEIVLATAAGTAAPSLVNRTLARRVRLLTHLNAGDTAHVRRDDRVGLRGYILAADATTRPIGGASILAGPLGLQAIVPFDGSRVLAGRPPAIQLHNPDARHVLVLRARDGLASGAVTLTVAETDLGQLGAPPGPSTGAGPRLIGRVRVTRDGVSLVDAGETTLAALRAGPDVDLPALRDRVVRVGGPLFEGTPPIMVVQSASRLFDVTITAEYGAGAPPAETYREVTIGVAEDPDSLLLRVNAGPRYGGASRVAIAGEFEKASALAVPQGRSDWMFLDCQSSRYDHAHFNEDHFPDGHGHELGVFDVSRFASVEAEPTDPVFASATETPEPTAEVSLRWPNHQPGRVTVNLPVDLPDRFGAKFNEGRFGQSAGAPERYAGAVAGPASDPQFIVTVVKGRPSDFVTATVVPLVPLGWTAARLPFRTPQFLTLGTERTPAYLYLSEEGLDGFVQLEAREAGAWGNGIAVTARASGPAMYDLEILYRGGRFENAREAVRGLPLPAAARELAQPSPIGVLQAKAAGLLAAVTRDSAEPPPEAGQTTLV